MAEKCVLSYWKKGKDAESPSSSAVRAGQEGDL